MSTFYGNFPFKLFMILSISLCPSNVRRYASSLPPSQEPLGPGPKVGLASARVSRDQNSINCVRGSRRRTGDHASNVLRILQACRSETAGLMPLFTYSYLQKPCGFYCSGTANKGETDDWIRIWAAEEPHSVLRSERLPGPHSNSSGPFVYGRLDPWRATSHTVLKSICPLVRHASLFRGPPCRLMPQEGIGKIRCDLLKIRLECYWCKEVQALTVCLASSYHPSISQHNGKAVCPLHLIR